MTYFEAIRTALREEMELDPAVFLMGEDIRCSIFGPTRDLHLEVGEDRVLDTPITESAFVGAAVGAAITGMRPVVEIMFSDFMTVCMDQIINQAAKIRFMTGGQVKVPLVIRAPGGMLSSSAAQHSQSLEALFMHIPGLKVCLPSNPVDAKGLLKSAIRDDDPVLFFEHKALYFASDEVPTDPQFTVPLGEAAVLREGEDVTIFAVSGMVSSAMSAANSLARDEISAEVIDPRTLVPLDKKTLLDSVRKTGRLVTVEEGCLTAGVGAEITALVTSEAWNDLEGPVTRVAAKDQPVPFSPVLEAACAPSAQSIAQAARECVGKG
ncbi:MAG: alpha-ketoacid dehydrogenase subunit beta [Actinobacteria bacterium]|nr:alpha-ketoacid dehydrogenase subunit beta [Actinomycetota bacterium]